MEGIIIALLLGWLGGYQFYKKKIGMGILYLFTGGLLTLRQPTGKANRSFLS